MKRKIPSTRRESNPNPSYIYIFVAKKHPSMKHGLHHHYRRRHHHHHHHHHHQLQGRVYMACSDSEF
jgi:hypothetical protein